MIVIEPNSPEQKKAFSMSFREAQDDLFLKAGGQEVSLRAVYERTRKKYPSRFRGAIVYSEEAFRSNFRETSRIMSRHFKDHRIHWAVKSAPIKGLVKIAAEEGAGFDVGSYEELLMARGTGIDGQDIYHTAPAKFDWDIEAIVEHNCVTISDNATELSLINKKAGDRNSRVTAGIRINPSIESSTQTLISTGSLDCKFGAPEISEDMLDALKGLINVNVEILHMHIGSQVSDPGDYVRALRSMVKVYSRFRDKGFDIKTLDIGGGYPFRYLDHPQAPSAGVGAHEFSNYVEHDFETYVSRVKQVLQENPGSPLPRIAIEPGRHIAAGSAFALGHVLNTKTYPNGIQWVMSSISVNDLFHKELIPEAYFDIRVLKEGSKATVPSAVGGTLCFSGDILTPPGMAVRLAKEPRRGDILFFNDVGAYSILGSGNFHNMPRLPVLMIAADLNLVELREQEKPFFETG